MLVVEYNFSPTKVTNYERIPGDTASHSRGFTSVVWDAIQNRAFVFGGLFQSDFDASEFDGTEDAGLRELWAFRVSTTEEEVPE